MNFGEILQAIGDDLQHRPDVVAHRAMVARKVNRLYRELMTSKAWTFRSRVVELSLEPDFVVATADWSFINERRIRILLPDGFTFAGAISLANGGMVTADWVVTSGIRRSQYMIDRVAYVSGIGGADLADGAVFDLYLARDFIVQPAVKPAGATIQVSFPRYRLPPDLAQLQTVMSRDDNVGGMVGMDPWTEQWAHAHPDDTAGEPVVYMFDSNWPYFHALPQGDRYDETTNPAPQSTPVAATLGAAALPAGQFQWSWAWSYQGRVSALGPPSAAITIIAGQSVEITNLDDLSTEITAGQHLGWFKEIYRRYRAVATDPWGPWLWQASEDPDTTSWIDIGVAATLPTATIANRRNAFQRSSPYEYLRFWPRPSTAKRVEVRYLPAPRDMILDKDEPELPERYHGILIDMAVAQYAAEHDDAPLAKVKRALVKETRLRMEQSSLTRKGFHRTRRSYFDGPMGRSFTLGMASVSE